MARESSEQERFEVLLEEVRHDLRVVAEGHGVLDRKIDRVSQELSMGQAGLDQKIDLMAQALSKKMDIGFAQVKAAIQTLAKQLQPHERAHAA